MFFLLFSISLICVLHVFGGFWFAIDVANNKFHTPPAKETTTTKTTRKTNAKKKKKKNTSNTPPENLKHHWCHGAVFCAKPFIAKRSGRRNKQNKRNRRPWQMLDGFRFSFFRRGIFGCFFFFFFLGGGGALVFYSFLLVFGCFRVVLWGELGF